ncbi:hypothetical protein NEOLEDRAFT_878437 [Neolentinus lepideus HHB14362 ss-1]|uniref:Uncharacterized protein n=1 Tax=Neolentinus lepideus HHB14362 ss-1 TaxID=1314782 RepID=A0A165NZ11_9AGAM|nr:hypothetical protein NEOLEDRAFT_878437 [Neolentinus lepideus HHB14362 ss-1]
MGPRNLVHGYLRRLANKAAAGGEDVFPTEVFERILKHLAPSSQGISGLGYHSDPRSFQLEQGTLRAQEQKNFSSLLLVCRSWHELAVPLLYRHICVPHPDQLRKLLKTLKRNPHFGSSVHSLVLPHHSNPLWCLLRPGKYGRLGAPYRDTLTAVVSAFQSIHYLEIEPPAYFDPPLYANLDVSGFPAARGVWPDQYVNLKSLTLHGVYLTVAFLGYPGQLPALEELCMVGTESRVAERLSLTVSSMQFMLPALHTLRLRKCKLRVDSIRLSHFPRLRTLELTHVLESSPERPQPQDLPSILALDTVQTLQFSGSNSLMERINYSECQNLQHLTMALDYRGFWLGFTFPRTLGRAHRLQHLDIVLYKTKPTGPYQFDGDPTSTIRTVLEGLLEILNDPEAVPLLEHLTMRGDLDPKHGLEMESLQESSVNRGIEFVWYGQYIPYVVEEDPEITPMSVIKALVREA